MRSMNIKIILVTIFFPFISDYIHVNVTPAMSGCITHTVYFSAFIIIITDCRLCDIPVQNVTLYDGHP